MYFKIYLPIFGLLLTLTFSCEEKTLPEPIFEAQEIDANIQIGYGLAIGDVDGDGKEDILLADKKQFVWYRNPDWQRFVMVDSLTERDNVCLAARDINGDGQVEVAVGAQWNPRETRDTNASGSVHYLLRPEDPTKLWQPIRLSHEPTVHRMHWVKVGDKFQLVVLPLHGRGNVQGKGAGVKVFAYEPQADPSLPWKMTLLDDNLHMTHNFDIVSEGSLETLLVGGQEGAKKLNVEDGKWQREKAMMINDKGFGEIRQGNGLIAGVQPIHGNELVVYLNGERRVLFDSLQQGHALACVDLIGQGRDQIVVGWRNKNASEELGIKLFLSDDISWNSWHSIWIDQNGMACEDLKVADLDGDGQQDIIAAGRSTHNLKIYWNRTNLAGF